MKNEIKTLKNLELLENSLCIYRNIKLYKNNICQNFIYFHLIVEICFSIVCLIVRYVKHRVPIVTESFNRGALFIASDIITNINTLFMFFIAILNLKYYKDFILHMNNLHYLYCNMPSYSKRLKRINIILLSATGALFLF